MSKAGRKPMFAERMKVVQVALPVKALEEIQRLSDSTYAPQSAIVRNFVLAGLEQRQEAEA